MARTTAGLRERASNPPVGQCDIRGGSREGEISRRMKYLLRHDPVGGEKECSIRCSGILRPKKDAQIKIN